MGGGISAQGRRRRCALSVLVLTAFLPVFEEAAAAGRRVPARPDLVVTALSRPPATRLPGASFTLSDATKNRGRARARATTTRYYLSIDQKRNRGDRLLGGTRSVPRLRRGRTSSGTRTLNVGGIVAPDKYFVLACADDRKRARESREGNNCRSSATRLEVTTLPSPGGPAPPPAPLLSSTNPTPPANANGPRVLGSAQAGLTVVLYRAAGCAGAAAGAGPAETLATPGIEAAVPDNAASTLSAKAIDASGLQSACSNDLAYTEDSGLAPTFNEAEPNGNFVEADARAADGTAPPINPVRLVHGSIGQVGEDDTFAVALPFGAVTRLEQFDASGRDCVGGTQRATLAISPADGSSFTGFGGGIGNCSGMVLPTGTGGPGYAIIRDFADDAAYPYRFEVSVGQDRGPEQEPNETSAQATSLSGSDAYRRGTLASNMDDDYYRITVPEGKSVRAETSAQAMTPCQAGAIDTRLELRTAAVGLIVGDDDDGQAECSLIDGTGSSPRDPAAATLPANNYYLRVAFDPNGAANNAAYAVFVTIR
jgi:hypothetical protein